LMGNLQEAIFTMNPDTTQVMTPPPHDTWTIFGKKICIIRPFFLCTWQIEVLFCSTIVGLPFLLPPMILTGELFKAWKSCAQVKNYTRINICWLYKLIWKKSMLYVWGFNENGWSQVIHNVPAMHNQKRFLGEINEWYGGWKSTSLVY
jgi:hypothetical protein